MGGELGGPHPEDGLDAVPAPPVDPERGLADAAKILVPGAPRLMAFPARNRGAFGRRVKTGRQRGGGQMSSLSKPVPLQGLSCFEAGYHFYGTSHMTG